MVSLLFERGVFTPENTLGVSRIVTPVIIDNVFTRMVTNILTRTSYVLKDTLTPPVISAVSTVIYFAIGRFLVSVWGYAGLVWARTIQGAIGISLLWIVVIRKLKKEKMRSVFASAFEYFLASAAAYLAIRLVLVLLASTPVILQLAAGGLVGLTLYLSVLYIRDREILISVLGMIGIMPLIDFFKKKANRSVVNKPSIESRMKPDDL
jgi:peptidoglycan biosynthesis protein MviN/MurJ (putative lipid II flippase)